MKVTALLILMTALTIGCSHQSTPAGRALPWMQSQIVTTDNDGNTTTQIIAATPADQATALWVRYGAIMAVVGILATLPVFGGNVRTGVIIASGGAAMAFTGKMVGDMTFSIPAWLTPVVLVLLAAGMLWGYHVRNSQEVGND